MNTRNEGAVRAKGVLHPWQRRLYTILLVPLGLMAANSIYLVAFTKYSSFFMAMLLMHLVLGLLIAIPFLVFAFTHGARMLANIRNRNAKIAGITTNVGVIKGGMTHNTVAPTAECELDIRFMELGQLPAIMADIKAILDAEDVPGTSAHFTQSYTFLPLEAHMSAELFDRYAKSAQDEGFAVAGEFTGGCSDAGFTAALGVPSLCGLGPVGGKAHTDEEFLRLETLVPRARALARTIAGM